MLIFMCFQIDVSDSCVTQMFLHSCVTQILTEHVHDARFCDLGHVADTLTLPFCIFSCGSTLMFLNNRDKYLTFWLILLFPLPRIVFCHAKIDGANIRFQIQCLWTCSWHFLSAHFHVLPSWCLWEIVINISLFEFSHKNLDYQFLRYYSVCYTVGASHVLYPSFLLSFMGFWGHAVEKYYYSSNYHVSFAKHPYENRTLLYQDLII